MQTFVEYRVVPVTRYVVTRYERQESDDRSCGTGARVVEKGEFDNAKTAHEVGYALAKDEHERLGYPPGDERIQYPKPLNTGSTYVQPAALLQVRAQMPTSSAKSQADNEAAVRDVVVPDGWSLY